MSEVVKHLKRVILHLLPVGSRRRRTAKRVYDRLRGRRESNPPETYQQWVKRVEPSTISPVGQYSYRPLISIVVPTFNPLPKYTQQLIDSIIAQTYDNWELVLVEGSTKPEASADVTRQATRDPRIKLTPSTSDKSIAGNTNTGIKAATGDYIAFLDCDDTLAPHALNEVVRVLQDQPDIDWFYSDEDKLSEDGRDRLPFLFKPDWSPDLFMNVNYVTHFTVVRAELVRRVKGIRSGYEGAQDFDFALRLLDHHPKIHHIPKILYHWRYAEGSTAVHPSRKPELLVAGVKALNEYLKRHKINAVAENVPGAPSNYHVRYATPGNPKASLIIPFKDKSQVTKVMIDSVLAKTTYPNYEIILVDNRSTDPATAVYLKTLKDPRIQVVSYDQPFNWSAVNNFGRRHATGEVLVFLNNDMEVINPEWLTELVGVAIQPGVGEVGAYLEYPNKSIQHAGVVLGFFGVVGHIFRGLGLGNFTYFGLPDWPRNYLAVTGACIAVQASKYEQVGGLDEEFITAGSDVRFGLALYEAGYRNVYWPFAKLIHYEGVSVGVYNQRDDNVHDYNVSMKYYRRYLDAGDPYFNPNLDLMSPQAEQIKLGDLS